MASRPLQSEEVVEHVERESEVENDAFELRDTPSMLLCERFVNTLDHTGVKEMQTRQEGMMNDLEIANIKLLHCVNLSEAKYEEASPLLKDSTRRLISMKRDVESLHRRIRLLKAKLAKKHPDVVAECEAKFKVEVPDADDDVEEVEVMKDVSILEDCDRLIQTEGNVSQFGSDTTTSSSLLQGNAGHGSKDTSSSPSLICHVGTPEGTATEEANRDTPFLLNGSEKQGRHESEECTNQSDGKNDLGNKELVSDEEVSLVRTTNCDDSEDSNQGVSGKLKDGISTSHPELEDKYDSDNSWGKLTSKDVPETGTKSS